MLESGINNSQFDLTVDLAEQLKQIDLKKKEGTKKNNKIGKSTYH